MPVDEALRLAMVAYAGGFAEMLKAGAHGGGAAALLAAANAELAGAGLRIIAFRHR